MFQAETLTLVAELQRSKRRWKILALGLLAVLIVLLVVAILLTFFVWNRTKAQQMRAVEAIKRAEQMRDEARSAAQKATGDAGNKGQEGKAERPGQSARVSPSSKSTPPTASWSISMTSRAGIPSRASTRSSPMPERTSTSTTQVTGGPRAARNRPTTRPSMLSPMALSAESITVLGCGAATTDTASI